jgi:hypothetical protein
MNKAPFFAFFDVALVVVVLTLSGCATLSPETKSKVAMLEAQCNRTNPQACLDLAKVYESDEYSNFDDSWEVKKARALYRGVDFNAMKLNSASEKCALEAASACAWNGWIDDSMAVYQHLNRLGYFKRPDRKFSWESAMQELADARETKEYGEALERRTNAEIAGMMSQFQVQLAQGNEGIRQAHANYQAAKAGNRSAATAVSTPSGRPISPVPVLARPRGVGAPATMREHYLAAAAACEEAAAKLPADAEAQRQRYLNDAAMYRQQAAELGR